MLRISHLGVVNETVTLRLEGRIVGPWVEELQRSCDEVLAAGLRLNLHLAEVQFMDAEGVDLLARLRSRGAELLECPAFAFEQLKSRRG